MMEENRPDHDTLVDRVVVLAERDRWDAVRSLVGQGLRSYPDSHYLLYYSAAADWRQDRLNDAAATLGRLLTLDPGSSFGRKLMAKVAHEQGRAAEAEQLWIGLIGDFPEDPELYFGYARLMITTLHADRARRLVEEGLRIAPDDREGLFLSTLCDFVDGRRLDQTGSLSRLVAQDPHGMQTGFALALALQECGRYREALRVARELLRANPSSPETLQLVRNLTVVTHWSMIPLYPFMRWGWPFAIGTWFVVAFGLRLFAKGLPPGATAGISIAWLAYCIYSWVWPRVLPRLI